MNRRFRFARAWSNAELRKITSHVTGHVLNVSGWRDEDKEGGTYRHYFANAASYSISNTVGVRGLGDAKDVTDIELDLSCPLSPQLHMAYDTALSHTTLEHIFDVHTAFHNLCDLCRDSVIVVVPFAQMQHETQSYGDYWRFTPSALRRLFEEAGMSTVYESATPGASTAVYLIAVGARCPDRWKNTLPSSKCGAHLGDWIGAEPSMRRRFRELASRLRYVVTPRFWLTSVL